MTIEKAIISSIQTYRNNHSEKQTLDIGILVSGGVDSIVLLHVLNKYKTELNLNILVLHVKFDDYPSYLKAELLVKNYCSIYNLECYLTNSIISSKKTKIKETARKELKEISFVFNHDLVFTAHHKDDQIETILFRILRGAGTNGIKGMSLFSEYSYENQIRTFCKPFINIHKEELIKYAEQYKLDYVTDETNLQTNSDRNFLRLEILPRLKQRFNVNNLILTADNITAETQSYYPTSLSITSGSWKIEDILNLPVLNRVFLIKEYFRVTHSYFFNRKIHKALIDALSGDLSNFYYQVGHGFELKREGNYLVVSRIKEK